jgi:hypothetical protein
MVEDHQPFGAGGVWRRTGSMRLGAIWVSATLGALAAGRIAAAIWAAIWNIRGDYYASLPGAYVEAVNPTLWNSPDMEGAWGYHVHTYFHGPAQYLTLYPVAYLDSYAAIARVLLPIYAVLLAATFALLRAAAGRLAPGTQLTVPLFASTFLFFPLLQSFIQREFEVVVCLGLSAALWLLLQDRRNAAAAVVAYVAWFKYVPLLFLGYVGLRGWLKAAGVFVLTSIAILAVAHAVFGLPLFVNNNVPGHAAQVFNLWSYGFERKSYSFYGTGFCHGWFETETTLANVRHALCAISFRAPWVPANVIYLLICLAVAASYLVTHARFERVVQRPADIERWRRALEFSIVTTVYSCFFFNHYYYLIVLIIPLAVLLTRYLTLPRTGRLVAWTVAYVLLSAFVIPTSVLTQLSGVDVWAAYIKGAWFMWGELLLMYLLLREYWDLSTLPQTPSDGN